MDVLIIGYFLESRSSADLARFLGVTESRVSQLRSEALDMLRTGIEAQYGTEHESTTPQGERRRAVFAAAVADSTGWRERLS